MFQWVVVVFITIHAPDGQEVELNAAEISSIRRPREADGHFAKGARCLLTMTNGKFFITTETCLEVVNKIAEVNEDKSK
jgi:uncharacterized protein YlzI (FlbEa/FlbD family)